MTSSGGSVALLLHGHLPYVRPWRAGRLEEAWLHEALWECYLPLVRTLRQRLRQTPGVSLALSLSPTLVAMLADPVLMRRFDAHLSELERWTKELQSVAEGAKRATLRAYQTHFRSVRDQLDACGGDVLGEFRALRDAGVELWTTAASHALLPALRSRAFVRAQIRLGVSSFRRAFGSAPAGLWLPECAFDPSLDELLATESPGVTVIDAHAVLDAPDAPASGTYRPVRGPATTVYLPRDPQTVRAVWSRKHGYPGHGDYRDFYRDAAFDEPTSRVPARFVHDGRPTPSGLKLHRIEESEGGKLAYEPERARSRADADAERFAEGLAAQLAERQEAAPLLVAPFDMELFGHWWWEGPRFLSSLLAALPRRGVAAVGPASFVRASPPATTLMPVASTWGQGGYADVWTHPRCVRLWRHVHHAERIVQSMIDAHHPDAHLAIRALLLLSASDLPFMVSRGEMVEYAEGCVRKWVARIRKLDAGELSPQDRRRSEHEAALFADLSLAELTEAWRSSA